MIGKYLTYEVEKEVKSNGARSLRVNRALKTYYPCS